MQGSAEETIVTFGSRTGHEALGAVLVVETNLDEPDLSVFERAE